MNSIALPIEARCKLTAETLLKNRKLVVALRMRQWRWIALNVFLAIYLAANIPTLFRNEVPLERHLVTLVQSCIVVVAIFYARIWREKKNSADDEDKELTVRFNESTVEISVAQNTCTVRHRQIAQAGRDARGLALTIDNFGGIGIPTSAFLSDAHRDFAFDHLRAKLQS